MNTSEKVSVTYDGIEIEYLEADDKWCFELRGRERKADTLAKAKEAIDKPAPQEKTFVPIKAYFREGLGSDMRFKEATITSLAEVSGYDGQQVWYTVNGKRGKAGVRRFIEFTEENDALIAEAKKLKAEAAVLEERAEKTLDKIKKIEVPK